MPQKDDDSRAMDHRNWIAASSHIVDVSVVDTIGLVAYMDGIILA